VVASVSFRTQPGRTTAIIGSTGSGKTTLVKLVPRFFDATEGTVSLDGVDVRDMALDDLRGRIDQALTAGLPVFVSEWGTSRADGSGGVFLEESAVWLDFLDARGISWCAWSLCDKDETSAVLRPGAPAGGPWSGEDLSPSGQFVFSRFAHNGL
jgi:energy-coupling factor transporter ATP-binding protein EcfA2